MSDASEDLLRATGSPRIVELLGVPGAGKSTLAATLVARPGHGSPSSRDHLVRPEAVTGELRLPLGAVGDRSFRALRDRVPPRASAAMRSLLWRVRADDALDVLGRTHPEFLELVAHAPPPPDADASHVLQWRSWPLRTLESHVLLRRTSAPGRTVLVEEGVVMRANTVCAGDETLVEPYLRRQPVPDVVVVLRLDAATALERLGARNKRTLLRHEGLGPDRIIVDLERTVRLVDRATEILPERGVTVVVIDAATPTDVQRATVLRALVR